MLWRCYQTISSCFSCTYVEILSTWEVWRALKRLELLSAAPRATLTPLSCSPNFPRAQYLDIRTVTHELIVKLSTESWNLIDFQAQVSSVKDVCQNNRQLLYLFIYLFIYFLMRIKNIQKDVSLNYKQQFWFQVHSRGILILQETTRNKSPIAKSKIIDWQPKDDHENVLKQKQFSNFIKPLWRSSVFKVLRKMFLKPCFLFVCKLIFNSRLCLWKANTRWTYPA